jgi:hypothetical protein
MAHQSLDGSKIIPVVQKGRANVEIRIMTDDIHFDWIVFFSEQGVNSKLSEGQRKGKGEEKEEG